MQQRYIAVDTLQKKKCYKSNIRVKYYLLILFDTCCGGIEIPPFQLSFPGKEEPATISTVRRYVIGPTRNPLS